MCRSETPLIKSQTILKTLNAIEKDLFSLAPIESQLKVPFSQQDLKFSSGKKKGRNQEEKQRKQNKR